MNKTQKNQLNVEKVDELQKANDFSDHRIEIGISLVGLALVGYFAAKSYHQRKKNVFFPSASLLTLRHNLTNMYLSRGPIFVGTSNTPIKSLDSLKAFAIVGANRSGKTVFISNYILSPWLFRFFCPPRGLYLSGDIQYSTADDWLRSKFVNEKCRIEI